MASDRPALFDLVRTGFTDLDLEAIETAAACGFEAIVIMNRADRDVARLASIVSLMSLAKLTASSLTRSNRMALEGPESGVTAVRFNAVPIGLVIEALAHQRGQSR